MKNKGFTLIELTMVVSIFSFILVAMYGVLFTARRTWLTGEALLTEQENLQLGLARMTRELRLASFATVGADNKTVRFNIPIDADGDGFIDLVPGTSSIVYGADDPEDFNHNGQLWESGWRIEYQIDETNKQIIRRVLDNASAVINQRTLVEHIIPDPALVFFKTETGGTGVANEAVIIGLATRIDTIQGITLKSPQITEDDKKYAVSSRVNLRN